MTNIRSSLALVLALLLAPPIAAKSVVKNSEGLKSLETYSVPVAPSPQEKVGPLLKQLIDQYKSTIASDATATYAPSLPFVQVSSNKVLIEITTYSNTEKVFAELKALGLEQGAAYLTQISGFLPFDKIDAVVANPFVRFVQASMSKLHTGATTSQGDVTLQAPQARAFFNVDGTGVNVGTMSDSFSALAALPNYASDLATNDLSPVTDLGQLLVGGTDEGRAMMQIVHDVAPGAKLFFRTGTNGEADFALGIQQLVNAGVHVINDDVLNFFEPWFQDGIVAQAATKAVADGVSFFSAAANQDANSYQSAFRSSGLNPPPIVVAPGVTPLTGIAHDFDPGAGADILQRYQPLDPGETFILLFQWAQPFATVCPGCPGPTTDLNIGFINAATNTLVASSAIDNILSGQALEILVYTNTSGVAQNLDLLIVNANNGPNPDIIKTVVTADGTRPTEFDTASSTSVAHANAPGVVAVASSAYFNAPPLLSPPRVNSDSSTGGTPIVFDTAGNQLSPPEIRENPDVTGPDGGNNTFFGSDEDTPPDGYPNFFGTSAATPHIAGVAALVLDNASSPISPANMELILEKSAIDIQLNSDSVDIDPDADPFDFSSGFGLVQAFGALPEGIAGAVCGDLDNDGVCINADSCPDDPTQTAPGVCGCNSPPDACHGRGSGGSILTGYPGLPPAFGPSFPMDVPAYGGGGGQNDLDIIAAQDLANSSDSKKSSDEDDKTEKPSSSEQAPQADAALEDARHDDTLDSIAEGASCSSINGNVNGLFAMVLLGLSWLRVRRKRS